MIERLPELPPAALPVRKTLRMVKNERMAGAVPQWVAASTAKAQAEERLSLAQGAQQSQAMLAYRAPTDAPVPAAQEEFGFGDLLDMVNPLHHVPVVGHVYRKLTGDQIHPIGQIIGGAVYGGPAGAAGGVVSAIVRAETGGDVADNALALMRGEGGFAPRRRAAISAETLLGAAARGGDSLPGTALAFADLGHAERSSPLVVKRGSSYRLND